MTTNFHQPNHLSLVHFPSEFRYLPRKIECRFQAPVPIVVSAMMTTLAVAMQEIITVEMPNGMTKPVSLSIATIAESGDRKTTVYQEFMRPIYNRDQQAEIDFGKELGIFDAEENFYKIKERALREALSKAIRSDADDQSIISNKLQTHMNQNPHRPVLKSRCHSNTTIASTA